MELILLKYKIKLPSLSEQTAIAEILATADRELQLQKRKTAQLQTQKRLNAGVAYWEEEINQLKKWI